MTLLWGDFSKYAAENIPGCERGWDQCVSLGVFRANRLIAVVVYHDWNPEAQTMCMSAYASDPRWLTRQVLWEIFDYPFNRAGCQMVIYQVSENNTRMLGILRRFGFSEFRLPRGRGRSEDEMICTLTDDQWRESEHYRRHHGKT